MPASSDPTRILCEVPPRTPDLCAQMWAGQEDPLYAIGSSWHHRRQLASDLGLPWSTGEGEGFYTELSLEEISALRRAAQLYLASMTDEDRSDPDASCNTAEEIESDATFFLGLPRDEGPGWPAVQDWDYAEDTGIFDPGACIIDQPEHGYILAGERARRELAKRLGK